ncbi:MAG: transporter substrate-binding protein [Pseudomonadota bacterium]
MSKLTVPAAVASTRRDFLVGATAVGAGLFAPTGLRAEDYHTSAVNRTGLAVDARTAMVGILHSETGPMALAEAGSIKAEIMAIERVNAQGGVLGRQIEYVKEDGKSDPAHFANRARKLLGDDRVTAVMGCGTSASRKAVLPVFEELNGFLYYPTFYEGLEQSPNVIYTGQEATQQIIAGIEWAADAFGARTFYLIGSDYVWPRTANRIARSHIEGLGLQVLGEEYYELGHVQFRASMGRLRESQPDIVCAIVVGGSNVAFYKQLAAAGIDIRNGRMKVLTISVTEDEIGGIGGEFVEGAYMCAKYFQSIETEANRDFVKAYKARWGEAEVISDVTQCAYLGPWLWKAAVERAGSFDVDKVNLASPGIELPNAPAGHVEIHTNHHLWSKTRIGRARADGQFDIVHETDTLIEPDPFYRASA